MKIAITGTPGTGKTSVAKELGKRLGWKVIGLHDLAREKKCISGFDEERKCDIIDTEKLSKAVKGIKGDAILDAHYSHETPVDAVFVLRTNPGILRSRMRDKGWKEKKVEENVQAEIMEVCKTESLGLGRRTFEVDTTRKEPEEVVKEILKVLKSFFKIKV